MQILSPKEEDLSYKPFGETGGPNYALHNFSEVSSRLEYEHTDPQPGLRLEAIESQQFDTLVELNQRTEGKHETESREQGYPDGMRLECEGTEIELGEEKGDSEYEKHIEPSSEGSQILFDQKSIRNDFEDTPSQHNLHQNANLVTPFEDRDRLQTAIVLPSRSESSNEEESSECLTEQQPVANLAGREQTPAFKAKHMEMVNSEAEEKTQLRTMIVKHSEPSAASHQADKSRHTRNSGQTDKSRIVHEENYTGESQENQFGINNFLQQYFPTSGDGEAKQPRLDGVAEPSMFSQQTKTPKKAEAQPSHKRDQRVPRR